MKHSLLISSIGFACLALLLATSSLSAATHYVSLESTNAVPPYTNWATAATNIQQAVDVAATNDVVLVTNGVYAWGVWIERPLKLLSVNGPQFTVINGEGANSCVYLASDDASVTGFTLTNGYAYMEYVGAGGGVCSSSTNAFVTDCVIVGNSAPAGGGAFGCTLYNCTLAGNSAPSSWRWESTEGGGAYNCTLYNCTLSGNSACYGGGASACTLYNCTLTGNSATGYYCYRPPLWRPVYYPGYGGGASLSTLYNCTLTSNSADIGGGADCCTLYNCIAYFNATENYDSKCLLDYCCTTPLPDTGVGNIALDPELASASHLSAGSPCRGAGSAAYGTGTDIDGEPWLNPPSIGCDEHHPGGLTGPLTVELTADYTNVAVGYPVSFTALIAGRTSASAWDFGNGVVVSNQPYASHAWTAPGDYRVVLRAYNESLPEGVSANLSVHVVAGVIYVTATSTNPQPPYASWSTAATNIQQAVDTALGGVPPGAWAVVVTNGVYAGPIMVTNDIRSWPVTLRSANGPQFTAIDGGGTNQCVFLSGSAGLVGFTLTNGSDGVYGSGVVSNCVMTRCGTGANESTLYNCTLTRNSGNGAHYCMLDNCALTANSGAGADGSTLYDCALTANAGLGAYQCGLYNCTLTGNDGGGVSGGMLYNSIAYFNTASGGANYDSSSALNYCCTTPMPGSGVGNIALDPQLSSASRLSPDSPCRGAGSAAYTSSTDIDGEPWCNPPSIGCDEYHPGAVTGPLAVGLVASYTNVAVGYPVRLTAVIEGRPTDSVWEFGDGDRAINEPYATHIWTQPGDYLVGLWAFNESHLEGVGTNVTIHVIAQPVVYVAATSTNPQPPYSSWSTAATSIQDAASAAAVPGTFLLVTNGIYAGGVTVTNPVALQGINGPQFTVINGARTNQCVFLANGASLTGFTLRNGSGGVSCHGLAVVSNCVITGNAGIGASGGTLYSCALTANASAGAWLCAVYNSTLTGNLDGAVNCTLYNCVLRANSGCGAHTSTLLDCTLTGNASRGVESCTLYNCVLTSNPGLGAEFSTLYDCTLTGNLGGGAGYCTLYNSTLAGNRSVNGGGAVSCTLYNCTLTGNVAVQHGGGALASTLYSCTVARNSTSYALGGGVAECSLFNCIVFFNAGLPGGVNYDTNSTFNFCCTTPMPSNGVGNISNAPLFIDYASGNLRLQPNSPCINAGNNAYVTNSSDLDGGARIVSGTVDMGAYEYQGTGSRISYAWLQQFGLPTDGSADFIDFDIDGHNNWQEWVCGTCPTNASSALRLLAASPTGTNVTVSWESVAGINYLLERSANLAEPFTVLATNIVGQPDTTSYADTNALGPGPFFYRVGVMCP